MYVYKIRSILTTRTGMPPSPISSKVMMADRTWRIQRFTSAGSYQ